MCVPCFSFSFLFLSPGCRTRCVVVVVVMYQNIQYIIPEKKEESTKATRDREDDCSRLLSSDDRWFIHRRRHRLCRLVSSVVDAALDGRLCAWMPLAGEDADVGSPERGVTQGVADGIDRAVDVTEVVGKVPQFRRETVVFVARRQRLEQRQYVVRRPRQNESQQDGRQRFGRLALLPLLLILLLRLLVGLLGRRSRRGRCRRAVSVVIRSTDRRMDSDARIIGHGARDGLQRTGGTTGRTPCGSSRSCTGPVFRHDFGIHRQSSSSSGWSAGIGRVGRAAVESSAADDQRRLGDGHAAARNPGTSVVILEFAFVQRQVIGLGQRRQLAQRQGVGQMEIGPAQQTAGRVVVLSGAGTGWTGRQTSVAVVLTSGSGAATPVIVTAVRLVAYGHRSRSDGRLVAGASSRWRAHSGSVRAGNVGRYHPDGDFVLRCVGGRVSRQAD